MRKLHGIRNKERLSRFDTTYFVGNRNEIRYYKDTTTKRVYAEACFEYVECIKDFMYKEWFQLSKNDIKDDDAITITEKNINMHFGYFGVTQKTF